MYEIKNIQANGNLIEYEVSFVTHTPMSFFPSAILGISEEEYDELEILENALRAGIDFKWEENDQLHIFQSIDIKSKIMDPTKHPELDQKYENFEKVLKESFDEIYKDQTQGELLTHPYRWIRRLAK